MSPPPTSPPSADSSSVSTHPPCAASPLPHTPRSIACRAAKGSCEIHASLVAEGNKGAGVVALGRGGVVRILKEAQVAFNHGPGLKGVDGGVVHGNRR